MDGMGIGRKVDLNAYQSYESLALDLEKMFQPTSQSEYICDLILFIASIHLIRLCVYPV